MSEPNEFQHEHRDLKKGCHRGLSLHSAKVCAARQGTEQRGFSPAALGEFAFFACIALMTTENKTVDFKHRQSAKLAGWAHLFFIEGF